MHLVTSREYKVILKTAAFRDRGEGIRQFWREIEAIAQAQSFEIKGLLSEQVERQVEFYDTPDHNLLSRGYVLRRRAALVEGQVAKVKAMLKYRSPDVYIASSVDVSSPAPKAETKLEEDILAPFRSQFAHSTSAPVADAPWTTLADVLAVFPGLDRLKFPPETPIERVGGLVAQEFVSRGATLDFGQEEATVAVTLWYEPGADGAGEPAIAEFSFAYGDPSGEFTAKGARRAKAFFEGLQKMAAWYDPSAITKTQFAYGYGKGK
jgi:hypothetical protein